MGIEPSGRLLPWIVISGRPTLIPLLTLVPVDIEVSTSSFLTDDGVRLFVRHWIPEGEAVSTIGIVTGYAEHCGRYDELGRFLAANGHAVHAYDHRGAGRSEGKPGLISDFNRLVRDAASFVRTLPRDTGPRFLLGHSVGGAVVLCLIEQGNAEGLDGVILSSPALRPQPELPAPIERIVFFGSRYLPFIPTIPVDRSTISRDPAVVEQAKADPLSFQSRVSLRTAAEIIRLGKAAAGALRAVTIPVLVIVGTGDRLINPACSLKVYSRVSSADRTISIYHDFYHETFREPDRDHVMDGIRMWLAEHVRQHREKAAT